MLTFSSSSIFHNAWKKKSSKRDDISRKIDARYDRSTASFGEGLFTFYDFRRRKVSCTQEFYFHATAVNSVSGSKRREGGESSREREKKKEERSRVSHLNARLEIIPLGHFLVLRRGNLSPSAQLLLGVVQVKDRHRIQPALEHQARQVLNVVLPKGEKYPEILVRHEGCPETRALPRPGRSCNAGGRDRTSSGVVSAPRVARTFRDRPRLARAAVPAASYGSFELDTRRNGSWMTWRISR